MCLFPVAYTLLIYGLPKYNTPAVGKLGERAMLQKIILHTSSHGEYEK